jgi:hypothetical protein
MGIPKQLDTRDCTTRATNQRDTIFHRATAATIAQHFWEILASFDETLFVNALFGTAVKAAAPAAFITANQ